MGKRPVALRRPVLRRAGDDEEVARALAIVPAPIEKLSSRVVEDVRAFLEEKDGAPLLERREELVEVGVR